MVCTNNPGRSPFLYQQDACYCLARISLLTLVPMPPLQFDVMVSPDVVAPDPDAAVPH